MPIPTYRIIAMLMYYIRYTTRYSELLGVIRPYFFDKFISKLFQIFYEQVSIFPSASTRHLFNTFLWKRNKSLCYLRS